MSTTSQDAQAREVETSQQGARWHYRIIDGEVHRSVSGVVFREVQSPEVAAAIRRIAEMETEREYVRSLLDEWAARAHRWSADPLADGDDVTATLMCCDDLKERLGL